MNTIAQQLADCLREAQEAILDCYQQSRFDFDCITEHLAGKVVQVAVGSDQWPYVLVRCAAGLPHQMTFVDGDCRTVAVLDIASCTFSMFHAAALDLFRYYPILADADWLRRKLGVPPVRLFAAVA